MKRLLLLAGAVFFLTACGSAKVLDETKDEETTEAATTEQSTETTEAPTTEAPTTEAPTTEAPTTEASESDDKWETAESETEESSADDSKDSNNSSIGDTKIELPDSKEVTVESSSNKSIMDALKDAKMTDKHVEDIIKPLDEVESYVATADLRVSTFNASGVRDSNDEVSVRAQVNEKNRETYTEKMTEDGKIVPAAYGKGSEKYIYDQGKWNRYSGSEEIFNGLYSKLFYRLKSNDRVADIYETSNDYIIYYNGSDRMPFHTVGNQFHVELKNIKLSTFQNTLAVVVDKNNKELKHILYVAGAKDEGGNSVVVEIAADYKDYGIFDNKTMKSPVQ